YEIRLTLIDSGGMCTLKVSSRPEDAASDSSLLSPAEEGPMRKSIPFFAVLLLLCPLAAPAASARGLSFQERVAAQEAIERVYYGHQIGATLPFDVAVPRSVIERKVDTYLRLTEALRVYWHTEIDAEGLRQELARIAASTRF